MKLPPEPPAEMVVDLLRQDALPAVGAAAFVFAALLIFGRWNAALAGALALVAAFVAANFQPVDHGEKLNWETTHRLVPWKPEKPAFHHLPRAALVLLAAGVVSRWLGSLAALILKQRMWWLPSLVVWLPRWVAVLVVGSWVIPAPLLDEHAWLKPALAAAMFFVWIAADGPARSEAGGLATALLAACFLAASVVFIYAHSQRFMELAIALGFGFLGIGAVAQATKAHADGAVPAAAALVPALALNVKFQTESLVPAAAFWLLALAPLGMLPTLIPRLARQNRWLVAGLRMLLVLAPLVAAVMMALEFEQLPPEEDW